MGEAVPTRFCLGRTGPGYGTDASEAGSAHRAASARTSTRPQRSIMLQGVGSRRIWLSYRDIDIWRRGRSAARKDGKEQKEGGE